MRALLVGSALPAATSEQEFWNHFADNSHILDGYSVYDPFVGGGSTLIEALRLGAHVYGGDVDPLAVKVVKMALQPADPAALREAGNEMIRYLTAELGYLYPMRGTGSPLHYFSIAEVTCPACSKPGHLFRNLVLARDRKKHGSVVRDAPLTVFCPVCFSLHELDRDDRTQFLCCGRYHRIDAGTFTAHVYRCPHCEKPSSHRDLRTGIAPRRVLAVEDVIPGARRRLRAPDKSDVDALALAEERWERERSQLSYPSGSIHAVRRDDRPRSYGIERYEQMFTPRQLLMFGYARGWMSSTSLSPDVRDALELALSNALTTNNRLCGYATDYGRLSALFTVRGYSLPALSVELNPLHIRSGRGSLVACVERVASSAENQVRRSVWSATEHRPISHQFRFERNGSAVSVAHRNAETPPLPSEQGTIDIAVFDPPYYDYIVYDELSEFYRAWFDNAALAGEPLLPQGVGKVEYFGKRLGKCLQTLLAWLRPGRPLAFTYHGTERGAWQAVGIALDQAGLHITALWPVRSDGHMGHHSNPGNSEWDVVVVCRPTTDVTPAMMLTTVEGWVQDLRPVEVNNADRMNFSYALEVASQRYGILSGER